MGKETENKVMTIEEFDALLEKKLATALLPLTEKVENKIQQIVPVGDLALQKRQAVAEKVVKMVKALKDADSVELKALTEGTAADGGYLVPEEFMAEVQRIIPTYGIARRLCRIIGMGSLTKKIPALTAGVTAYWIGEKIAKTTSKWTLTQVTLTAKKLAALIPMTDELLDDSAIGVMELLADLIGEAFAKKEDEALFVGSGSITGIMPSAGVVVTRASGTAFSTITADNLLDMTNSIPSGALAGAKFYLNPTVLAYIQKLKTVSTLDYIYQSPSQGLPPTIWGRPYEVTDAMPASSDSAADTAFVLFGNLKRTLFGNRKEMTLDVSKEATVVDGETTYNMFQQDMQALRGVERLDIAVPLPGAFAVLKTAVS